MTLAELGFEFEVGSIDNLLDLVQEKINIDTYQVDTPQKIYEIFEVLLSDLKDVLQTNFENLATDFEEYWNTQAENLKTEIEQNLALDPTKTYDIHVTNADLAQNSLKFDGKTSNEYASYIVSNFITPATVNNALHLEGKSLNDILQSIPDIKVNNAVNADKLNNMTYDDIISTISAQVSSGTIDYDLIQNKVENEWTAYQAKTALAFGNSTWNADYWKNTIIPNIKVNNAAVADSLKTDNGTVDYNTLIQILNTLVTDEVEGVVNSNNTDFVNLIKSIKVNNAVTADKALNSDQLGGYDFNSLINYIKTNVTVDNAVTAEFVGELDQTAIETLVSTSISNLTSDLSNGDLIPKYAQEPISINGISVENFDDHINELISNYISSATQLEDAKTFNGYDFDQLMSYIQSNVKVDNALNADYALDAGHASTSDDSNNFNGYSYGEVLANTYDYFDNKLYFTRPASGISNFYVSPFSNLWFLLRDYSLYKALNEPFALNFDLKYIDFQIPAGVWYKKIYEYDSNGNITKVIYLNKNDNGDLEYSIFDEKIAEEIFTYDSDNNIQYYEKYLYMKWFDANAPIDEITLIDLDNADDTFFDNYNKANMTFYIKIQYNYDTNGNIVSEEVVDGSVTIETV